MERITISLEEDLAREFDALIRARAYANRSEAIRDLLRRELEQHRLDRAEAPHCVANLSYVYNHHERRLAERLTNLQHHAHDLVVSSMHVHLDHENCLETVILRGPTDTVRQFADQMSAERGVRHGTLNLVPVEMDGDMDRAMDSHAGGVGHVHSRPRS